MYETNLTPQRVAKEYDAALRFNQGIDLYDCVQTNENFFVGKQWEGVQANGLPTPVFNFLKRVVLFSVANVSTDNLKLHARPLASSGQHSREALELLTDILNDQFTAIFEMNKMGACIREFCRNAAVDGDGCMYAWWDPAMETGQAARGGIRTEVLRNTQVMFGNPNDRDVQAQPYILIEKRMLVEEARHLQAESAEASSSGPRLAREIARAARDGGNGPVRGSGSTGDLIRCGGWPAQGCGPHRILPVEARVGAATCRPSSGEDGTDGGDYPYLDDIVPDDKESGDAHLDQLGGEKVTVLTRLWRDRDTGTIHAYQCTRTAELRGEWDLKIKRYPLIWMNWDYVQDCYHGQAMITGLIPNQIFVNKLFAMCMISLMTLAYPKVIYDRTKVAKWSSRVGAAIGVNGSVEGVAKIMDPASISPQISQFIELAVGYTQKFLGASDVALGDARPDNTSAIIALQRAAATPMELTKQSLLQAIEDMGRIYMEFMGAYYGQRLVEAPGAQAEGASGGVVIPFDFAALGRIPCSVELDVGASSYWSEIAAMQTLDNLLVQGKISTVEYLKRLPAGQITDREALISALQQREGEAAQRGGA